MIQKLPTGQSNCNQLQLPPSIGFSLHRPTNNTSPGVVELVVVYRIILYIFYYTAILTKNPLRHITFSQCKHKRHQLIYPMRPLSEMKCYLQKGDYRKAISTFYLCISLLKFYHMISKNQFQS